jgi:hypothetical protein
MPQTGAGGTCKFCGTGAPAASVSMQPTSEQRFRSSTKSFRPRGQFEDLILHLLDLALMTLTLIIGGIVWSVIAALAGQTPAGKVRDQVLVSVRTSTQAPTWRIVLRQTFSAFSILYILLLAVNGPTVLIDVGGYYFATYVIPFLVLGLIVVDGLFTITPIRRRLVDWLLALRWVDGEGHSFRNYKPPGGFS